MNVLTTTEVSEKWHISPRRIAKLASQGRIPDAKYVDNRWLIPSYAEKPCDARYSSSKKAGTDCYVFPYILGTVCHDHSSDMFNAEEKCLYKICLQYENGEFADSINAAECLMRQTSNTYVRIGCLYILIFSNILLRRFDAASQALFHFLNACMEKEDSQYGIYLLENETRSFFYDKEWFLENFSIAPGQITDSFTSAYLSTLCCLQDLIKSSCGTVCTNTNIHELNLSNIENRGYIFLSVLYHWYLSMLYACSHNVSMEYQHLKKAFDIAAENSLYSSLSGYLCLFPARAYSILSEYPENVRSKFSNLIELSVSVYADFLIFSGSSTAMSRLSKEDYILISYCLRNFTLEKISELEGISLSKTKRKMIALYKKTGVKGKAELCSAYSAFINKPGQ